MGTEESTMNETGNEGNNCAAHRNGDLVERIRWHYSLDEESSELLALAANEIEALRLAIQKSRIDGAMIERAALVISKARGETPEKLAEAVLRAALEGGE